MAIKPIDLSLVPKNSKYPSHVYKGLTDNVTIDKLYHGLFPDYELSITSDWYENITKQLVDFNLVPDGGLVVNNERYLIRSVIPTKPLETGQTYISIVEGDFEGFDKLGVWGNGGDALLEFYTYIGAGYWILEFTAPTITKPQVSIYNYPSTKTPKKNNLRFWGVYKKSDVLNIQLRTRKGTIHVCDGSNILLNSHVPATNNGYPTRLNDLIEKPIAGEWYTLTIKAKLGEGKTGLGLWNSGGSINLVTINKSEFNSNGIASKSFVWRDQVTYNGKIFDADNSHARVYVLPGSITTESTIYWLKLEKGKESTGYSKAQSELITSESNRNLMDIIHIEPVTLNKYIPFGKTLAHIISTNAMYGGLVLNLSNLEPNTRYCLSYEVTKLSGSITRIGGHTDSWIIDTKMYIDGILKSYPYNQPTDETIVNDGKRHLMKVYFTTGADIQTSKLMYIQPNRGVTANYEALITHIMITKNESSWEPVSEDMKAIASLTKPYTYQPDNKVHYLPYSYQVPYSDSSYNTVLNRSRFVTSTKSTLINPTTPEQYVTIPLTRTPTIWKETETVTAINFARTVVNDVNVRAENSYIKTQGVNGSKTLYTTIETLQNGSAIGNVVKDYEVITKNPTNEIYIQGTAVITWKREVYKTESIPYSNINQNTDTLYVGETKISQTGIAGVRSYYRDNEYMNGAATGATRNVDTTGTVTTAKRDQITLVGTKPRTAKKTITLPSYYSVINSGYGGKSLCTKPDLYNQLFAGIDLSKNLISIVTRNGDAVVFSITNVKVTLLTDGWWTLDYNEPAVGAVAFKEVEITYYV